jgi:RAB protein geranylgeranyltransferase component A
MSKTEPQQPVPIPETKATITKPDLISIVSKYQERTFAEDIDNYEKLESNFFVKT